MSEVSVWCYPWDLHDIGLDTALGRLADAGATMVSLATSYHAGRFVQPGNPRRRVYFPQDGTVYYTPDPDRWRGAEIVPLAADIVATEGCMLTRLAERRTLGLSCWTVCLHNTRLGMLHPGHVMRTAHGDPHFYALCPSSPAAMAYVTGMVAEIGARFAPDRIELESPDFMGFSHGFHHEKDGLPLLPEDDFLLGLCFCPHCMVAAQAAGCDAEAARRTVVELLDAAFARELPASQVEGFPSQGIAAFAPWPDLLAYLHWRPSAVTRLVAACKAATPPGTRLLLIDAEGTWAGGVDLPALVPHIDGLLHCAYTVPTARIAPLMAETRGLLGPDRTLIAGFQLFHPTVTDAADLTARVAATKGHVDGQNFYNLGLVPPARLGWIRRSLEGV